MFTPRNSARDCRYNLQQPAIYTKFPPDKSHVATSCLYQLKPVETRFCFSRMLISPSLLVPCAPLVACAKAGYIRPVVGRCWSVSFVVRDEQVAAL